MPRFMVGWEALEDGGWVDDMGEVYVKADTPAQARSLIDAELRRLGLRRTPCRVSVMKQVPEPPETIRHLGATYRLVKDAA